MKINNPNPDALCIISIKKYQAKYSVYCALPPLRNWVKERSKPAQWDCNSLSKEPQS